MTDPVLQTSELTKTFGALLAVDNVDLELEKGEFRSLIGPNGAGKTTLFNLLTGRLKPDSGTVQFNDRDVTGMAPHECIRLGLGRSFQITNIFDGLTVRENVRLAAQATHAQEFGIRDSLLTPTDRFTDVNETAERVLDRSGLLEKADELPHTLAYGERRRVEIAIVLATDPELVLLDEPMAGMSTEETESTLALIDEVLGDRSILLIEHDIDLVMRVSDQITVLNQGQILATGTPSTIAGDPNVRDAYLGGVDV